MSNKFTLKEAGYIYIRNLGNGHHELQEDCTLNREVWFSNKHHVSFGIKYKNTHLEFAHSVS